MSGSQHDIKRTLQPNGSQNVMTRGEFVFYKAGSAKLLVTINQQTVEMEPGDVRRMPEPFESFEISSQSGIAQKVELVAGFGEYNRLVVRGEISSFQSTINAAGLALPDTRHTASFIYGMTEPGEYSYTFLDSLGVSPQFDQAYNWWSNGFTNSAGDYVLQIQSTNTMAVLDKYTGIVKSTVGNGSVINGSSPVIHHPDYVLAWWGNAPVDNPDPIYLMDESGAVSPGAVFTWLSVGSGDFDARRPMNLAVLPDGRVVHCEANGTVRLFRDLNGAGGELLATWSLYDAKPFADPYSTDHCYLFKTGDSTIHRLDVRDGSIEYVMDAPFVTATTPVYNYLTRQFEYVDTNSDRVRTYATLSADFWGNGKASNIKTGGGIYKSQPGQFIKQSGQGHAYNDATRQWTANHIWQILRYWWLDTVGKEPPTDYMDYVFGIEVNGRSLRNTGNKTFLAEGVEDKFTVGNPCQVTLTIGEQLEPNQ